ncbi:MAG: hypothetical protein COV45_08905 [Deltaproteobacteria bacterium CG11_big_fil_rev_8_21_14_0_20_47_16]|nr:MAG: hypothetical protein COV45_08905 [Deltaproteobacteria bacterium CG11_big_fil_rev_8_21_14_0_20_47_16]
MKSTSPIAYIVVALTMLGAAACTKPNVFADYRQEVFPQTAINESSEKVIRIVNPYSDQAQKIGGIGFDGGGNQDGNFEIAHIVVAGKIVPKSNIVVPAGATLEVHMVYHPQKMVTTYAQYGGWVTGEPIREVPLAPNESAPKASETPVHRGMLDITYHSPEEGIVQVELVGTAEPGKNGERESGGGAGSECEAKDTTACFKGTFSITIEGLVKGDPIAYPMSGPVPIEIESGTARMSMDKFPHVLIVLKGNGPGEPLEGQPLSSLSIVVSGAKGITAVGSFDGSSISLQGVGMRIRIRPGEILEEDINPSMDAMADFEINDIDLNTTEPLTTGEITFNLDTTLSDKPSGNEIIDGFLAGAHVVVEMKGLLDLP